MTTKTKVKTIAQARTLLSSLRTDSKEVQAVISSLVLKERMALRAEAAEVAEAMGISSGFLSRLERGQRNWTDSLLERWEQAISKLK
jgi:transcriptional regulator with XRE-family HTH domain